MNHLSDKPCSAFQHPHSHKSTNDVFLFSATFSHPEKKKIAIELREHLRETSGQWYHRVFFFFAKFGEPVSRKKFIPAQNRMRSVDIGARSERNAVSEKGRKWQGVSVPRLLRNMAHMFAFVGNTEELSSDGVREVQARGSTR